MSAMRRTCQRALQAAVVTLALQVAAHAAEAPAEVHGHSDIFSANGVTIAWGVLRGATEDAAAIVLRVAADPARFAALTVEGVDPFTKERKRVVARRPLAKIADVRIPRSQFANFPRTELMFFDASAATAAAPLLTVYYLGVPDTAPEFTIAPQLETYLAGRIAQAAAKAPAK